MKVLLWSTSMLSLLDVVIAKDQLGTAGVIAVTIVSTLLAVAAIVGICVCIVLRYGKDSRHWHRFLTRLQGFRNSQHARASVIERPIGSLPHRQSQGLNNYSIKTKIKSNGLMDYFKAEYETSGGRTTAVARTVSNNADVIWAHPFVSSAKKLALLPSHNNVVELLGMSIDQVPSFTFHAYVKGGNVKDYLLKNYHQSSSSTKKKLSKSKQRTAHQSPYKELITFGCEVASAMNFLHTHKFLHPALGARKVLLGENNCCKVFDFWPDTEAEEIVTKLIQLPDAPIAWLSPESVFLGNYGMEGDVWSIGIFLWELFSFGETPYEGMNKDAIEEKMRQRVSLDRPAVCPGTIYNVITSAWEREFEKRPTSTKIMTELRVILESYEPKRVVDDYNYHSIDDNASGVGQAYDKLERLKIDVPVHSGDEVIYG